MLYADYAYATPKKAFFLNKRALRTTHDYSKLRLDDAHYILHIANTMYT